MSVFGCSSCGRLLYRPAELSGRAWQCPSCGPTEVSDEVTVSPHLAELLEEEYRLSVSGPAAAPARRAPAQPLPRPEPPPPPPATETADTLSPGSDDGKVTLPSPEAFRHNWARKALREAGLFLLLAVAVVLLCGLFLPIPSDVYWLLLKIVAAISAGVGVLFYLL